MNIPVCILPHGLGLELPSYQTQGAAGMDIRAAIEKPLTLSPLQRIAVPTGLTMALPQGYEGQVRPRSGLAFRHGLSIINAPGTIDADFRGEIKILLINLGEQDFTIHRGMRIAQLVIAPIIQANIYVVEALVSSQRGNSGFGSTGIE